MIQLPTLEPNGELCVAAPDAAARAERARSCRPTLMRSHWRPICAHTSRAKCGSTRAAARSTRPMPRTTARCRSASSSRATVDDVVRHGRRRAPASARRCSARGGGTSLAGQCCNVAVRDGHSPSTCTASLRDRPRSAKLARVQPGCVLDDLRDAAEQHGLTFGPDPATHSRCTLGGMIGNNSCGVHSVMAGWPARTGLRQHRGAGDPDLRRPADARRARPARRSWSRSSARAAGAARSTRG